MVKQRVVIQRVLRVRVTPGALGRESGHVGELLGLLLLALLAIPLSFVNPRAGRANNMLIALLVYLLYSNAISVFQSWVTQGRVGFVPGLLLPHLVVLGALGLLFYTRLAVSPFWRRRT